MIWLSNGKKKSEAFASFFTVTQQWEFFCREQIKCFIYRHESEISLFAIYFRRVQVWRKNGTNKVKVHEKRRSKNRAGAEKKHLLFVLYKIKRRLVFFKDFTYQFGLGICVYKFVGAQLFMYQMYVCSSYVLTNVPKHGRVCGWMYVQTCVSVCACAVQAHDRVHLYRNAGIPEKLFIS